MAFSHPHCGGSHETVAQARECSGMNVSVTRGGTKARFHDHEVHDPFADGPEPVQPEKSGPVGEGFYKVGEDIFKVQLSQSSGRPYAKLLTVYKGEDDKNKARWEYMSGAIYNLRSEHKLTGEEAAAFGKLYGFCVFCGKQLNDERSIFVGYGQICAGNYGLPWGATE